MMDLELAIRTVKRILVEAMAAESLSKYVLENITELVEAAKVIGTFGFDILLDSGKVMAVDDVAGGELLALLAEVDGEDPPLPQAGGMLWVLIAYRIAQLVLRLKGE